MKNKNVEQEKKEKIDWHSYSVEDTFKKVESSTNGLSDEQARERLAKDGANTLPRKKPKSVFLMFIEELINPIVLILLVAMAFSFDVGEILDGCVILGIVSGVIHDADEGETITESHFINGICSQARYIIPAFELTLY